jgi:hypothetical protein
MPDDKDKDKLPEFDSKAITDWKLANLPDPKVSYLPTFCRCKECVKKQLEQKVWDMWEQGYED